MKELIKEQYIKVQTLLKKNKIDQIKDLRTSKNLANKINTFEILIQVIKKYSQTENFKYLNARIDK